MTCSVCGNRTVVTIVCNECPEMFCPPCYTKCPELNRHKPTHSYRIKKSHFIRPNYSYEYEENLLKTVEHAGSMKQHYQELYVDGIIGQLTRETSTYDVIDHTSQAEDPGECSAVSTTTENELQLGLLKFRNDFAPEVHDDAEKILVDRPENLDPEIETLVGEMFHRQFKERHRKRKLVQEYGLVDRFFEWKEKSDPIQGLEQLCSKKFLDDFKMNLRREEKLKKRMRNLSSMISQGFTKYSDLSKDN